MDRVFRPGVREQGIIPCFLLSGKKLLHKLTAGESAAVTDNVFPKAFMAKAIEAPELQPELSNSERKAPARMPKS